MSQKSSRILIVEDDDEIREALEDVLQTEGYATAVAPNGKVALELIDSGFEPSLILLDLMMPVLNGWQFLEVQDQSEKLRNIPTIVLTAAMERQIPKGRQILRKPLDLLELLSLISTHCG